ncbi:MAG TPA: hypothetical protein ENN28_01630 [Candidatus Uhrbacteria bacterium]|nr:hypothetical protein [Candidatus Uhrbacteria bacterium]
MGDRPKIKKILPVINKFKNKKIKNINLEHYKKEIIKIFNILYKIKGIKSTGTPKLLHIFAPNFFVMWDSYIRKYYKFKKGDAEDYFNFLKMMQQNFKHLKINKKRMTLAKAIDEYNYIKITLPGLAKKKK